jgi:6-pyruvoyltetrahydropterin/6-carboxytetrahydropterin synthase
MIGTVTVEHAWPMGHRLQAHDGGCRLLHGHNYTARAEFTGAVRRESGHPQDGMVADFTALKAVVRGVLDEWDHALMLERSDPAAPACGPYARLVLVDVPPTAERVASLLLARLGAHPELPDGVRCTAVTVWESAATSARCTGDGRLA